MSTPHSNDPRDNRGDFVLGKDGQPIVDRYGRPIRRRQRPAQQQFTQVYQPRQYPQVPRQRPQEQPRQRPQERPRPRPQQPPLQVTPRSRRRKVTKKRLGCGPIVAIIVALAVALVLFTDARLTRVAALPAEQISNTAGTNWLLVGSDSRTGLSAEDEARLGTGGDLGTTRTDTIMLLHLPLFGQATLLSIPRDSYVAVPGVGYDKINAAFAYGGPQLLTQTVEQATGLRVDRYAEIGMGGLANVVDAVGGVEVCVAEPIADPLANIFVEPGCQRMDGATGLGYVRTRATSMGDLDRVQRQREFLAALVGRVFSPAVLLNPFRVIPLLWTAPTMFTVGQGDHVWHLARIAFALRAGLQTETIPLGGFADTEVGNVLLWDEVAAEQLFASLR